MATAPVQGAAADSQDEFQAAVTIAIRQDGSICIFDPLTPEAKQEFDTLDDALAVAHKQLGSGDPALSGEGQLDAKSAQAYWNELAAKKDAMRGM